MVAKKIQRKRNNKSLQKNKILPEPIIVNDKNDPRLRAYSDSLKYYNESEAEYKAISNTGKTFDSRGFPFKDVNKQSKIMSPQAAVDYTTNKFIEGRGQYNSPEMQAEDRKKMEELLTDKYNKNKFSTGQKGIKNAPIKYAIFDYAEKSIGTYNKGLYKKPVQPVVYQEEKKLEKPSAIPRQRDFSTGNRPKVGQAKSFNLMSGIIPNLQNIHSAILQESIMNKKVYIFQMLEVGKNSLVIRNL
jgi:hypothetical protein